MRYAFYRLTSPILDRIPDISHQPKGRVVSIGLAASLLFHLLLLLLAVGFGMILPEHGLLHFTKPKPKLEEIELTIIPPAPEPELAVTPSTPFIESRGLTPADKPADKPAFESDVDMRAASKLPGTGAVPLPTQQGEKVPEVANFESAPMSLAKLSKPFRKPLRRLHRHPPNLSRQNRRSPNRRRNKCRLRRPI